LGDGVQLLVQPNDVFIPASSNLITPITLKYAGSSLPLKIRVEETRHFVTLLFKGPAVSKKGLASEMVLILN